MSGVFTFGEQLDGYNVKVLNERAVRAGAGVLFAFAIVSFMNAWLVGNFQPTRNPARRERDIAGSGC